MNAKDYPITFKYGAYDGYYYTKDRPHRGNDRPTPTGTPVVVGNTVIGLTGNTGLTSGPHLHTQAGKDSYAQNTIDPSPYEFKQGIVTHTGTASQWGKHVIVKVNDVYVVYAHLSEIKVNKGDNLMATKTEVKLVFNKVLFRDPDTGAYTTYTQHDPWFVFKDVSTSAERTRREKEIADNKIALTTIKSDLTKAQNLIKELSARPTLAEYETAVKKLEKQIVDAETACVMVDEQEVVENWFKSLIEKIKEFIWKK